MGTILKRKTWYQRLLQDQRVDPSDCNNYAIMYASYHGNLEIVKLLLQDKRVDPSNDNNYAIIFYKESRFTRDVSLTLDFTKCYHIPCREFLFCVNIYIIIIQN